MALRVHKSAEWLVSCKIDVSSVSAVRKPEVVGSNPAIDRIFNVFSETRLQVPIFKNKN